MKIKIHYKLTFIFILITGLILTGVFIYLNQNLRSYVYRNTEKNLLKEARFIKSFLGQGLKDISSINSVDEIADEIGQGLDVRATVVSLQGDVLGDSSLTLQEVRNVENHLYRTEIQQAIEKGIGKSVRFSSTVEKEMLYIAALFGQDEPRGIVRLSVPLSDVALVTQQLKNLLTFSFLAGFIVFIVLSFVIAVFVSSPLREMSWIAGNVARGDFSQRIDVKTRDEIGDLAKSFNFMIEQIREKIKEVTANQSRLEAVLLSMFDGVLVVDIKARVILINQTLKKLFNIKKETFNKRPIEIIRNIEIQNLVEKSLKLKEGVAFQELSLLLPEKYIFLIHATPVIREGIVTGAVLVFHDITELRKLENIRKDFVANVSHELRTPVTNIKGYTETLVEGALEDKDNAKEFLQIIHSETERLVSLINDILSLSAIESDKLELNIGACNIKDVIREVVSRLKKEAEAKSVKIDTDFPDSFVDVLADRPRITQVIFNLVDNAIKYNRQGGKVCISLKPCSAGIEISVSDTGVGISQKHMSRIFERFYRINKDKSREKGGTGLGLSIVKHIVSAHNSRIQVKSSENQGTTFSFILKKA